MTDRLAGDAMNRFTSVRRVHESGSERGEGKRVGVRTIISSVMSRFEAMTAAE